MNRRALVLGIAAAFGAVFSGGAVLYSNAVREAAEKLAAERAEAMVRSHSPIVGPADAPVTIVEFLDPSCEACRAFYPLVKQIMDIYPDEVRLVIRYAAFHEGSEEAVRILEASRLQGKHDQVLEALFRDQPTWAKHDGPDMEKAWLAAGSTGVDLTQARADAQKPEIAEILRQDAADVEVLEVRGTPTFFVNARPLLETDPNVLYGLVTEEVMKARGN